MADLEKIRAFLEIDRWVVFGGSWGSTLALAYAQTHPEAVLGLILRGIFLARRVDVRWFFEGEAARIFPEAWAHFIEPIAADERDDLIEAYYRRLIDPDPKVHLPAAQSWAAYEGRCVTLLPSPATVRSFGGAATALSLGRLEAHYFINKCFMEEGALLKGVERIRQIPATIVQGRYDVVCPPVTAELVMVPDAGHSAMEPGIAKALVAATQKMRAQL